MRRHIALCANNYRGDKKMGKSMKRLFNVNGKDFNNKQDAKVYRNDHGGKVSKGIDHRNYGVDVKTHNGSRGHRQIDSIGDGYKK